MSRGPGMKLLPVRGEIIMASTLIVACWAIMAMIGRTYCDHNAWAGTEVEDSLRSRSLQQQQEEDVLGDSFSIDLGDKIFTKEMLQQDCELEYNLVTVCASRECANYTSVCPPNLDWSDLAQGRRTTCENVDTTICDSFNMDGEEDGCCINACALEMQDLALCVAESTLGCDVPPPCSVKNCTQEGDRFTCFYFSNITETDGTLIKFSETTISCAYDEALGLDIYSSNNCSCVAELTTTTAAEDGDSQTIQVCGCDICSTSSPELVSLDCSMANGGDDPFVYGECANQTCDGQCVSQAGEILAAAPTTTTPSSSPPTLMPSMIPTPSATTALPSKIPTPSPTTTLPTMLPTTGIPETVSPAESPATTPSTIVPSTPRPAASSSLAPTGAANTTQTTKIPTEFPIVSMVPEIQPNVDALPTTSPAPSLLSTELGYNVFYNATTTAANDGNNTNIATNATGQTAPTTNTSSEKDGSSSGSNSESPSSSSKWYYHPTFITFCAPYFALCMLLCILVSTKQSTQAAGHHSGDERGKNYGGLSTSYS